MASAPDALERAAGTSRPARDIKRAWAPLRGGGKGQGTEGDVVAGAPKILQETRFLFTDYSNTETYEGQLSLRRLLAQLPSFLVLARYRDDVLLRNSRLA